MEAQRRAHLAGARKQAGMALAAGAALGLLFALFGSGSNDWQGALLGFALPTVFGAVAGFLLWKRQERAWSGSVAEAVMPVVCDFLGGIEYDHDAHKGFPLERMRKLGVVRSFTRSEISDRLEGEWRNTPFEIVEAKLMSRNCSSSANADNHINDRSNRTLFKGLLLHIGVPEPIPTRILIARDYGVGNKLGELLGGSSGRGMPKVDTAHPEFERHFEVYSADPETARGVLAPGFLDSLLHIAESEGGRHGTAGLEAGFHEGSFFMALKRDEDFLAMGSLTTPMDGIEEDLHRVFADIALVRRIIDQLHGEPSAAREVQAT
jgi:hypothetical protein